MESEDLCENARTRGPTHRRLNCSHGDHGFYADKIARLREYLELRPNTDSRDLSRGLSVNCAVALDLKVRRVCVGHHHHGGGSGESQ